MHRILQDMLACPGCRANYHLRVHSELNSDVTWGFLRCSGCGVIIPIAEGFVLFTEPLEDETRASVESLRTQASCWFGAEIQYRDYVLHKHRRGDLEPYAAFHPFNESTRAFETVAPVFDAHLQDGNFVLDPWSRTGWNAEWLASRFPRQRIIALWEGDSSVLGYRGFRHWLNPGRKSANLGVIFSHPDRGLPLRDKCIDALYTLDSLHRFDLGGFASECLRVSRSSAPLAFAHIHLSNSEPVPWFDRGGTIRHGKHYRAWLDSLLAHDLRRSFIWSEADLFTSSNDQSLPADSPDTSHYNGFILVHRGTETLRPAVRPAELDGDHTRFLVNPFFTLHLQRRRARVERSLYDGMTGEMLDRHPLYWQRLPTSIALDDETTAFMVFAVTGCSLNEIAAALQKPATECLQRLAGVFAAELLLPVTVTKQAYDLQRFHSNQYVIDAGISLLNRFLAAIEQRADIVIRGTGIDLTGREARRILVQIAAMMQRMRLGAGSTIGVSSIDHPLGFLTVLAGLSQGANVTLLDKTESTDVQIKGLDLLVHPDGMNAIATRAKIHMALGLDGSGTGLLKSLEDEVEPTSFMTSAAGSISSWVDGRFLNFDGASFLEAAYSFSAAAGRNPLAVDRPHTFGAFLSMLIALINKDPIVLRSEAA